MKLDKTATQDGKNMQQKAQPAVNAPEHHAQEARATASGAEKRSDKRQQIIGLDRLAPRTRVILDAEGKDVQPCQIRDVSDRGYRIA